MHGKSPEWGEMTHSCQGKGKGDKKVNLWGFRGIVGNSAIRKGMGKEAEGKDRQRSGQVRDAWGNIT